MDIHYYTSITHAFILSLKLLLVGIFLASCNFNITDNPGPQISSSIKSSKKHNTFICAYRVNSNTINNIHVKEIFLEKKYFLHEGFFGNFEINCCESQLVIIFKEDNKTTTLNGVPMGWAIIGFNQLNSLAMVQYLKGFIFPNTINIILIPNVKSNHINENIKLFKVN